MLKSLNRDDIQVTPFVAKKKWNPQNIDNDDLILWMSASLSGSISHIYIDYGDGLTSPYLNSSCALALQQQENNINIIYEQGTYISGTFFQKDSNYYESDLNPLNIDGSYKRLVYDVYKNLFYNSYENPVQLLGVENINLSGSRRNLTDIIDVFTLTKEQYGEKIVPKSVKIIDSQLNEQYTIVDDGQTHLLITGSYFINFQELDITHIV